MQAYNEAYTSLNGSAAPESRWLLRWYGRVPAFAASWCILAGFLSLIPLLDDDDAQLRLSRTVVVALSSVFLGAGFTTSTIIFFLIKTWHERFEVIALPGLTCTSLGLFSLVYALGTSRRYSVQASAGLAGLLTSGVTTALFGALCIICYVKSLRPRYPKQNRFALGNIFPVDIRSARGGTVSDNNESHFGNGEAPVTIIAKAPPAPDEEETRQQMLRLLQDKGGRARPEQATDRSTYWIDLPADEDQVNPTHRSLPTSDTQDFSFQNVSNRSELHPLVATDRQNQMDLPAHVRKYYQLDGSTNYSVQAQRGRQVHLDPRRTSASRSRSREDRRREIEMGVRQGDRVHN